MTAVPLLDLHCAACGRPYPIDPAGGDRLPATCSDCGGFWAFGDALAWKPPRPLPGLRAWAHALGLDPGELSPRILCRPAIRHEAAGHAVWISQQGAPPEPGDRSGSAPGGGSFKERGAEVLAAVCARLGLREVYLDSSGNAGVAMAGAAAARGIACRVLVPASTPPAKLARLEALGARVEVIAGDRRAASAAARELRGRLPYASHIVQPFFRAGVATLAWDLAEELGGAIERVVVPVGHGSLLLGLALGFERLVDAGRIERSPRLHAVQLAGYASLAGPRAGAASAASHNQDDRPSPAPRAAGIAIVDPPRRDEMSACIARSGGDVTVVTDRAIAAAREEMRKAGFPTDPTGAAAWAGLTRRPELAGRATVIVLTSVE